jgi:hypothetical protein
MSITVDRLPTKENKLSFSVYTNLYLNSSIYLYIDIDVLYIDIFRYLDIYIYIYIDIRFKRKTKNGSPGDFP